MKRWLIVWCLLVPAWAEDAFQLLRSDPTGYAEVQPGYPLRFPGDHLPHPAYRIEWWYLTANLTDNAGRHWGVHWTLFRQSMTPEADPGGWASNQVWMAHAALSTPEGHRFAERFARGGIGQAGVERTDDGRFNAWLDDWRLRGTGAAPLPGRLTFRLEQTEVELELTAGTPWVRQGDAGYTRKSDRGQASYYYSQPHIEVAGSIRTADRTLDVSGRAWLDREWSSQPLAPDQPGWDWFALHLDDGYALMVYRLRHSRGEDWISGSWIAPDGDSHTLSSADIRLTELSRDEVATGGGQSKTLPLEWHIELPGLGRQWRISAHGPDHWLDTAFPYWEGPVRATGTTPGVGYLEMTGY